MADYLFVYENQEPNLTQLEPSTHLSLGPLIVTDPTTGRIYFLGDGLVRDAQVTNASDVPKVAAGQAALWSWSENAALSTYNKGSNIDLQKFTPEGPDSWQPLNTTSPVGARADHCFVPGWS